MASFSASIIISFYNKLEYLKMIEAALQRQSFKDFEIIIADDGSRPEVVAGIQELMATSPISIQHCWHEDIGFRKTKILNESIRKSRSNYLIFIDGDCIPHSHFIEEHVKNRSLGTVLAGRRVNLSERLSKQLRVGSIQKGQLDSLNFKTALLLDSIAGKTTHAERGIFVKSEWLRNRINKKITGILGCNFSIHKSDLEAINGFDERYQAPAVGEDTDIELRLRWLGIKIQMIKNMAIQYHIYHKKLPREMVNEKILEQVKADRKHFTPFGIRQEAN